MASTLDYKSLRNGVAAQSIVLWAVVWRQCFHVTTAAAAAFSNLWFFGWCDTVGMLYELLLTRQTWKSLSAGHI